jgi:hypothetical protein
LQVEVHINGHVAFAAITDLLCVADDANMLMDIYRIEILKKCEVEADVIITGVQSKMNDPEFEAL